MFWGKLIRQCSDNFKVKMIALKENALTIQQVNKQVDGLVNDLVQLLTDIYGKPAAQVNIDSDLTLLLNQYSQVQLTHFIARFGDFLGSTKNFPVKFRAWLEEEFLAPFLEHFASLSEIILLSIEKKMESDRNPESLDSDIKQTAVIQSFASAIQSFVVHPELAKNKRVGLQIQTPSIVSSTASKPRAATD